jgi:hypothetical protein
MRCPPILAQVRAFIARTVRAVGLVARDRRIPRPLRWLLGLGLLPIPGPFDEALLLVLAPVLFVFYRRPMREAWERADRSAQSAALTAS